MRNHRICERQYSVARKHWCAVGLAYAAAVCLFTARGQTPAPGTLDSGFNPVLGPNYASTAYSVVVQPDGKILIGGDFTQVNGQTHNYLARLAVDGTPESGFGSSAGADGYVRTFALQSDGKILVGGDFYSINGASWRGFARLGTNGMPDVTLSQFSGVNGRVIAIGVQADGKILIGGSFTTVNSAAQSYLARLNTDGSLDTTFAPLLDSSVETIKVRPDGEILVGGDFTYVNNVRHRYLVLLTAAGQVDTGFNIDMDDVVYAAALQANGQVIVGGRFTTVNSASQQYVVRLNSNGTKDATFTATPSGTVYSLALQADGKVLIGGRFSLMNGSTWNNLARVNSYGVLDSSFSGGVGPDYTVHSLALQSDGKVLLAGEFKNVNMVSRTFVARLYGDPPPPVTVAGGLQIWTAVEIGWSSQTNTLYQVQWSSEAAPTSWQNFGQPIAGTGGLMTVFDSSRSNPRRFYRVIEVH